LGAVPSIITVLRLPSDEGYRFKKVIASHISFGWKFIKRWLETKISPMIADGVTRRELFRLAAENQLIVDVEQWMRYHEARKPRQKTYS
jgi:hypothetical protein